MMNSSNIALSFSGSEDRFYFDSLTETFGTVISKTPAYEGVYRIISGEQALTLILKGKLTREQLTLYEGIRSYTGIKKIITIDERSYSDMAVESVKAEFEGGSLMGEITVVLSEVN